MIDTSSIDQDILQSIYDLERKYLTFKLGEEQVQALFSIFKFLNTDGFGEFVYYGAGGTGKTFLTKIIVEYLESNWKPYILATPTNKARGVLSKVTGKEVITLHKLLTLKPSIDILELDFKDLKFSSESLISGIPDKGVLMVDECSMINSDLYQFIVDKAKIKKCKVLFFGDSRQLYAVNEHSLSKPFQIENHFELTKIYRQSDDNPILEVLETLRERPLKSFSEIRSKKGNLCVFRNWERFITTALHLFRESIETKNPEVVKLLAYTNKRVEAFNSVIRNKLYSDNKEYQIGEILMGYDTCEYKIKKKDLGFEVINSEEYIVNDIKPSIQAIGHIYYKGFDLSLTPINSEYYPGKIFIISRETSKEDFKSLAAYIELLRLDAIQAQSKAKSSKLWRDYFKVMNSFITPVNLIYNGRTVRKKSLDYGYCISVHKSQGSNYNNVLIDMQNIFVCKNKEELRQLQYVALSRTRNNISMLL